MEEKIRNKIITMSGEPVSGKGTTVKKLEEYYIKKGYNVFVISVGEVFREISLQEFKKTYPEIENPTIEQVNNDKNFAEKRKEIDLTIDSKIAEKGKEINSEERPNDVYIIDSRLAFNNIPDSFAVRLTVDDKIAGERVFNDNARGNEDKYESVEQAIEATRKRKEGEIARYKQRYGVDLTDINNYNLVIDTSYETTEDIVETIIKCEELERKGEKYGKVWASPQKFLPLQSIKETKDDKII